MNNFIEFDLFELLTSITQDPWLLSFLIMLATFILEDAATTTASLLTVNDMMPMHLALSALIIGIILGDIGLYLIGSYGKKSQYVTNLLERKKVQSAGKLLENYPIRSIILARFVPGMRLPTYVAMGLFGTSIAKFVMTVLFAVTGWTLFLFFMVYKLGHYTMYWPADFKWFAIGFIFILAFTLPQVIGKIMQKLPAFKK